MAIQVQWRRGTEAQNDAFTGAVGEITVDTTNNALRVHDGSTAGGHKFTSFPSGTDMLFYQSAAPDGWTKNTTAALDDHALRVVTTTAFTAGTQGTNSFSSVMNTAFDSETVAPNAPAHNHTQRGADGANGTTSAQGTNSAAANDLGATLNNSGGGSSHEHEVDIDVKFLDVIICAKD